jgi:cobalt-zinc-cadmium efflux system membrane fusion protein
VIYDGDSARVWAMRPDGAMIAKPIKVGVANGGMLEALSGVAAGDKIVTKGSIFIDRAATED